MSETQHVATADRNFNLSATKAIFTEQQHSTFSENPNKLSARAMCTTASVAQRMTTAN